MHTTSHVLMIRPCRFGFNPDTAASNAYQQPCAPSASGAADAQSAALAEFDAYVTLLRDHGVTVQVIDDTPLPHTPDSIFPNNWFSSHADGRVYLYPMEGANRRLERRADILQQLAAQYQLREVIDLSASEQQGRYLEGTGSMVFDRAQQRIYAAVSSRSDTGLLQDFAVRLGYRLCLFHAADENGLAIYHSNVMLCVGDDWAVLCAEAIRDAAERERVLATLVADGKTLIVITLAQVRALAGNMLALRCGSGEALIVLSQGAFTALDQTQRAMLASKGRLLHPAIPTIETLGGGGVRCMLAELFLPLRH